MKTINLFALISLFVLCSCNSGIESNAQKVSFGIYEIARPHEVLNSEIDTLKTLNLQVETNQQVPIIGYMQHSDSLILHTELSNKNIKLVKSIYTVDNEHKYFMVVAVKTTPTIINADIKNTKVTGNCVEIYFNMQGSKKWAELTKKSIGNSLAFVIDNQIYTMPMVNAEIRSGLALIDGFENEAQAKSVSDALNNSLVK